MLAAIQRLSDHVGYIAGWTGSGLGLAKTSDDGESWQQLHVPTSRITDLQFINEQVGWAGGFMNRDTQIACQQAAPPGTQPCQGVVIRTQDGGQTWAVVLAIPTDDIAGDPIRQIQAVDGQRAWALTLDASSCQPACLSNLQRTIDGGRSWTTLLHGPIETIRFASADRGWIALSDPSGATSTQVQMTSDGGNTWKTGLRVTDGQPFSLDAASAQVAWAVTRNGAYCTSSQCTRYSLYRTDNGGLSWAFLDNPKDFAVGCTGGHLAGPLFASPTRGWFGLNSGAGGVNVGPGGMLKSEDGGRSWTCKTMPPYISMISAADPGDIWAAGPSALYSSKDAGATWKRLTLP